MWNTFLVFAFSAMDGGVRTRRRDICIISPSQSISLQLAERHPLVLLYFRSACPLALLCNKICDQHRSKQATSANENWTPRIETGPPKDEIGVPVSEM